MGTIGTEEEPYSPEEGKEGLLRGRWNFAREKGRKGGKERRGVPISISNEKGRTDNREEIGIARAAILNIIIVQGNSKREVGEGFLSITKFKHL